MLRRFVGLLGIAVAFVAITAAAPPAQASSLRLCVPVHAIGVGQDNGVNDQGQFTTIATVRVAGVKIATSQATFTPGQPNGSTLPFTGPIAFSTELRGSTLIADVRGSVDLSTGEFTAASTRLTGTGVVAGVSGQLRIRGLENLATGAFRETITGRLCAPSP